MPDAISAALATPGAVWLALAAFIAGCVRGFAGFGTGMVYLPVAGMFLPPFHAIATIVAMDLLGPLPNLPRAWKSAHRPDLARLLAGVAIGLPIGLTFLAIARPETFRVAVSLIALAMVAALVAGFRLRRRPGPRGIFGVGMAGGAMGGFAGLPGPPVILTYIAGPNTAEAVRANTMLYLWSFDIIAIAMLSGAGRLPADIFLLGLLLGGPNLAGNLIGAWIFDPGAERAYRRVAYVIIAASALLGLPLFG